MKVREWKEWEFGRRADWMYFDYGELMKLPGKTPSSLLKLKSYDEIDWKCKSKGEYGIGKEASQPRKFSDPDHEDRRWQIDDPTAWF